MSWKDLAWVRSQWSGPLIIKGILEPEDAREAVANGADALVVSNHGGRQLDGALSSARALPPVADAVGGEIRLLADGGVRSGLDVVRMLALGADFGAAAGFACDAAFTADCRAARRSMPPCSIQVMRSLESSFLSASSSRRDTRFFMVRPCLSERLTLPPIVRKANIRAA